MGGSVADERRGGPAIPPLSTARDTLALPFGADLFEPARSLAALVASGLLIGGLLVAHRAGGTGSRRLEWIVPATLIVAAPAILFGFITEGLVYPRHFLIPLTLLVPLMGGAIAELFASRAGRVAAALVVVLFLGSNVRELATFLRDGRGDWVALLEQVERESPDGLVPIGSDNDFRNGMLVEFHRVRSRGTSRLRYVQQPAWDRIPPAWLIVHAMEKAPRFPQEFTDETGGKWTLLRSASCGGPTGTVWGVYSAARRNERSLGDESLPPTSSSTYRPPGADPPRR